MSGGFELGEGFGATPLEPASPVRHEVLIVTPGVSPIEHAGLVVVSEAADVAVPIMIHDDVVMDLVAGGRVSAVRARTSVLLNQDDTVTASGHVDPVAIDLHVLGILDIDIAAPTPSARITVMRTRSAAESAAHRFNKAADKSGAPEATADKSGG